jgi:hypothetical protein
MIDDPILSAKDAAALRLRDVDRNLEYEGHHR